MSALRIRPARASVRLWVPVARMRLEPLTRHLRQLSEIAGGCTIVDAVGSDGVETEAIQIYEWYNFPKVGEPDAAADMARRIYDLALYLLNVGERAVLADRGDGPELFTL